MIQFWGLTLPTDEQNQIHRTRPNNDLLSNLHANISIFFVF